MRALFFLFAHTVKASATADLKESDVRQEA